jgi:hypothetical protein
VELGKPCPPSRARAAAHSRKHRLAPWRWHQHLAWQQPRLVRPLQQQFWVGVKCEPANHVPQCWDIFELGFPPTEWSLL